MSSTPDDARSEQQSLDAYRARRQAGQQRLMDCDHLGLKRFLRLDAAAYEDATPDGLDSHTKELLGLVASAVLRCNDCIDYHLEQCIKSGATKPQLIDAMNIALLIGGSIVIPHFRHAVATIDALKAEADHGS